jgi:hypothetical protein
VYGNGNGHIEKEHKEEHMKDLKNNNAVAPGDGHKQGQRQKGDGSRQKGDGSILSSTHDHAHEHIHKHTHPHVHDGVHSHTHAETKGDGSILSSTHDHTHTHTHDHTHAHAHTHAMEIGAGEGTAPSGTDKPKLKAILSYMKEHNKEHAKELHGLIGLAEHLGADEILDLIEGGARSIEAAAEQIGQALELLEEI